MTQKPWPVVIICNWSIWNWFIADAIRLGQEREYFVNVRKAFGSFRIQYWPKVTHSKTRTSHAGCNASDARIRRVLPRICYSNVAHMKRASCVQHLRGMCAGCCSGSMWHTRVTRVGCALLTRLSRVCVVHSCIADVAHFKRVGSARDHGLLLVSTVARDSSDYISDVTWIPHNVEC
jgi:hypothetical protein